MLSKVYKIETDRLIIRCYHPSDAPRLKQAIDESLDHLRPWMEWAEQEPETVDQKAARLRKYRGQFDLGVDYVFGVFDRTDSFQVGSTGLHIREEKKDRIKEREIGYWIRAQHTNKGYATELTKALMKVGFTIEGLEKIEIHCDRKNIRSQKIPRKLGFELLNKDAKEEHMFWSITRDQYLVAGFAANLDIELKAYDILGNVI